MGRSMVDNCQGVKLGRKGSAPRYLRKHPAGIVMARTIARFDCCISRPRSPPLFFVDDGAAIEAASTMVRAHIINPFAGRPHGVLI